LLNNGDGTFEAATPIVTEDTASIILAGDFTGSGNLDVAVLGSSIEVFPGNGAGGFGAPQLTPLSEAPADAVAADFNGDHKTEIAFGTVNNNSIYIYSSNGDGKIDLLAGGTTVAVPIGQWRRHVLSSRCLCSSPRRREHIPCRRESRWETRSGGGLLGLQQARGRGRFRPLC